MADKTDAVKIDIEKVQRALGFKIEAVRASKPLRQSDLCRLTGLGSSTISGIENGRQTVSLEQVLLIAAALEVPADILIRGIC